MKIVLFICVENARRSQMAEALFNEMARRLGVKARAVSAGTNPAETVDLKAVEAMRKIGINIEGQKPKLLTGEIVEKADRVITMGCGAEVCPIVPKEIENWRIEDPKGKSIRKFMEVRDEIQKKILKLLEELGER
jgi:arsenate reductase